jgi:hypothetical protein
MSAHDRAVRVNNKHGVMEFASLTIPFWMGEKQGHAQSSDELAQAAHPRIRLRDYPISADLIDKAVATDAEFRRENPCRS